MAMGRFFPRRVRITLLVLLVAGVGAAAGWSRWRTGRLLLQGEKALAAREYSTARDFLERYLSARPGDARARLLAARAARRLRAYYEAREHLDRCRKNGVDSEVIDVEEDLIRVQRGDERPVEGLRQRAAQDDELAVVILEVLIQHDLDTYQLRPALHELTHYLELRPDDLQALLGRGYVQERFLYFRDALGDYRKAVAAHPRSERARLCLADTLLIVGTPAEALAQYEWLAERAPRRPEVRLGLARCRRKLGEVDQAKKLLDDLLAEAPDHGEALWERGQLALEEHKPTEAEAWLHRAARRRPHDRRVNHALYLCLLELKRLPEAQAVRARVEQIDSDLRRLDQVRQEVMKRPLDANLRCEGGLLFLRNGERREAVRWLRQALRLDPACRAARQALDEAESKTAEEIGKRGGTAN